MIIYYTGIYRVNYDNHMWEMIADTLQNNYLSIHHLNRAQVNQGTKF